MAALTLILITLAQTYTTSAPSTQFGGGGFGWGFWGMLTGVIGLFTGLVGGFIAWRRDRDLKQLDQQQKNRDDAISILRAQLVEQSARHEREIGALGMKVDGLEKQLQSRSVEWAETNKQLNERTLELAEAQVTIGRLNLQKDDANREAGRQAKLALHYHGFAALFKQMFPDQYEKAADAFRVRRMTQTPSENP